MRDIFCSSCGTKYNNTESYPRTCGNCGIQIWDNPKPVVVLLIDYNGSIYLTRRGIEPGFGLLALVGGYMVTGETWQEAAARETFEEVQILIDPKLIQLVGVRSSSNFRNVLIFGYIKIKDSDILPFKPNEETQERVCVDGPVPLAFPTHTDMLVAFFNKHLSIADLSACR